MAIQGAQNKWKRRVLWMNVPCTSDQLSYGDLLLVEDGFKLIPPVCILVNIPNSSTVCYKPMSTGSRQKGCLTCRIKASPSISFSCFLGQSVLQGCCKS